MKYKSKTVQRWSILIIPSCIMFYILGHFPYQVVEKRHRFQARSILRPWMAPYQQGPYYQDKQVSTTTYRQPRTLTWVLLKLRRVKDDPPKIIPPNRSLEELHITMRINKPNALFFTLTRSRPSAPSESVAYTWHLWPSLYPQPEEKMRPQIKKQELRVQSLLPGLVRGKQFPRYTLAHPRS